MGLIFGSFRDGRYKPPLIHRILRPKRTSGAEINGVGQATARRPSPIYHWTTIKHPFRFVQNFFYLREMITQPVMRRLINEALSYQKKPKAERADVRVERSAMRWSDAVKEKALELGVEGAGIARMRDEYVFEGMEVDYPWVIMLVVQMDYERLKSAPEEESAVEVLEQYNRGQKGAMALADWVRSQGYRAEGQCGPFGSPVVMIPAAIAAGHGELGKHGSLISRNFGANMRFAYVLTDMPLCEDGPDVFGLDEFCKSCQLCTTECPAGAIADHKQLVRGVEKWYVDFDKCVPYFNDTNGCGVCLAVCPWTRPGVSLNLAAKMSKKAGIDTKG